MAKRGLGKGLDALLADTEIDYRLTVDDDGNPAASEEIPLSLIDRNENQPRKSFDEVKLTELANSIRIHGVIAPIILVKRDNGRYMIIAGERRYKAAKKAGLVTIPAIVKDLTEKQISEISLIENLQREDLNPIEVANALKSLMRDYGYTQEEVADRIGKSRPAVANLLRLLTLPPAIVDMVAAGKISEGHARALLGVNDRETQLALANKVANGKLTVRDLEKAVKLLSTSGATVKKPAPQQSLELKDMIARMQRVFSTKVSVFGNDRKGRIYIDYFNKDDLDRILELVQTLERSKY